MTQQLLTGSRCPACGHTHFIRERGQDAVVCASCGIVSNPGSVLYPVAEVPEPAESD